MKFTSTKIVAIATTLALGTMGTTIIPKPLHALPSTDSSFSIAQATTGRFISVDAGHPTSGTARIVTENGKNYLVFDKFSTGAGPAVKVILYKGNSVPAEVDEENYITLANLTSFTGAQRYEIPENLNLDEFGAVGIWCERFNITFGYARL